MSAVSSHAEIVASLVIDIAHKIGFWVVVCHSFAGFGFVGSRVVEEYSKCFLFRSVLERRIELLMKFSVSCITLINTIRGRVQDSRYI